MEAKAQAGPWLRRFLDVLLPRTCGTCGRMLGGADPHQFCGTCWQRITRIVPPLCPRCGIPYPAATVVPGEIGHVCGACRERRLYFQAVRCAGRYEGTLQTALQRFKFEERTSLARPLAELLVETFGLFFQRPAFDAIIPVPLHRRRLRQRGYDQAVLLARQVAALLDLPIWAGAIERVRYTQAQVGLSRQARRENVRGAFRVRRPERLAGARLLLIDDVVTTSSTVNECARAAFEAGAERLDVLAVARSM
ncbi:MAG: ComF family protein [Candidatus Tectomicrobia bacterium]|nr:ComF family protein [Candidatus Tectomicrobia bacterium]